MHAIQPVEYNTIVPAQVVETPVTIQPATWKDVKEALVRHHHEPDLQAARAVCAAVAAHRLSVDLSPFCLDYSHSCCQESLS